MSIIIKTRPNGPNDPQPNPPQPPELQLACPHASGYYDEAGNLICWDCGKVLEESA